MSDERRDDGGLLSMAEMIESEFALEHRVHLLTTSRAQKCNVLFELVAVVFHEAAECAVHV